MAKEIGPLLYRAFESIGHQHNYPENGVLGSWESGLEGNNGILSFDVIPGYDSEELRTNWFTINREKPVTNATEIILFWA